MIGYYVHHHGSGHLQRARTLAAALPWEVTGLSSLPRPQLWPGPWVQLARDDTDVASQHQDPTVRGRFHWAPRHDAGLRVRQAQVSTWLRTAEPAALVVDQSVEVAVLARLHGVPVVGFSAPGRRGDAAHTLGFDCSDVLVGPWPGGFTPDLLPGADPHAVARFAGIGAVSRFPARPRRPRRPGRPRVALLCGEAGDAFDAPTVRRMQDAAPHWEWEVLGRALGNWVPDPSSVLSQADVVLTHAGQNAVAEVAAFQVPALVVPQERPFDEQEVTAGVLASRMPVLVLRLLEEVDWSAALDHVQSLDGRAWTTWADGQSALRLEELLDEVMGRVHG